MPDRLLNALGRRFTWGAMLEMVEVVASRPIIHTLDSAFPQVDGFTPHTTGIYSPSLATTLVATFWLPTGYHSDLRFWGINLDMAARADTIWTRKHRLEMLEL